MYTTTASIHDIYQVLVYPEQDNQSFQMVHHVQYDVLIAESYSATRANERNCEISFGEILGNKCSIITPDSFHNTSHLGSCELSYLTDCHIHSLCELYWHTIQSESVCWPLHLTQWWRLGCIPLSLRPCGIQPQPPLVKYIRDCNNGHWHLSMYFLNCQGLGIFDAPSKLSVFIDTTS